jgi:cation diffusion facilitator CzcD-associated flavoprotein CzcO
VRPVKNPDDGAAWLDLLHRTAAGTPGRQAVVVGGGYIGVEMAEAMIRRGLATTLITRSDVMSSPRGSPFPRRCRVRAGRTGLGQWRFR